MSRRRLTRTETLGHLTFDKSGRPLTYTPYRGVRRRVRCLADIERLYRDGFISSDDLLRARGATT